MNLPACSPSRFRLTVCLQSRPDINHSANRPIEAGGSYKGGGESHDNANEAEIGQRDQLWPRKEHDGYAYTNPITRDEDFALDSRSN